jgi:hypothetical protein
MIKEIKGWIGEHKVLSSIVSAVAFFILNAVVKKHFDIGIDFNILLSSKETSTMAFYRTMLVICSVICLLLACFSKDEKNNWITHFFLIWFIIGLSYIIFNIISNVDNKAGRIEACIQKLKNPDVSFMESAQVCERIHNSDNSNNIL